MVRIGRREATFRKWTNRRLISGYGGGDICLTIGCSCSPPSVKCQKNDYSDVCPTPALAIGSIRLGSLFRTLPTGVLQHVISSAG